MKVLFVCHRFPYPPKRGGKIRPFNIIKHLHEQGHSVTVASLSRTAIESVEGAGLDNYCEDYLMEQVNEVAANLRMVMRLATLMPSSMGYFYSPRLARRIKDQLERTRFDLIFVHCSSVAPYVAGVRDTIKILDLGDVDSQKWLTYAQFRPFPLSAGYWLEGTKLQLAEKRLARQFDLCTCTTRAELETFDSFGTGVSSDWFPNGVDTDFFAPSAAPYDPDSICFVGRMDYYPNQEAMFHFCADVFPHIRSRRPQTVLTIVGANPSRKVRRLARIPGVMVTGSVPDVRPWVRKAALTVAPLSIARGTQNKILEAMAMGVPVVASSEASGGIDAVAGKHLLVASNSVEFAGNVLRLLENETERQALATAGRERVLSNHTWSKSMDRLDSLIGRYLNTTMRGSGGAGAPLAANNI